MAQQIEIIGHSRAPVGSKLLVHRHVICFFIDFLLVRHLRVNHYDFVALHSMWRIFLKG